MAKVKTATLTFDEADLTDVVSFRVYYSQGDAGVSYKSPFITIPVVAGQTEYPVEFPTTVPVTDGQWNLGVSALDDMGNESDMDAISPFFDFIPPAKPVWRR